MTKEVEPRNADAKANAMDTIIPTGNDGFLTSNVIVCLEADELGNTVYPVRQVTITVPANGVAYASFDYSDLPPGDARLKVRLDVIETPTHDDSDESAIITIKFSNIADEDGESDWLVVVIVLLTGLVMYGGYKTAEEAPLDASDIPIEILPPLRRQNLINFRHILKPLTWWCCSMWEEKELGNIGFIPEPSTIEFYLQQIQLL